MQKDYFQSEEFKDLFQTYTEQMHEKQSVYFDAEEFADIADYYLDMGEPASAMEAVEKGLAVHPNDDMLLSVQSSVYIYEHSYLKAKKILDQLDQDNSDVQYQQAQILYAHYGKIDAAEKKWREWMRNNDETAPSEEQRRECYIHIISSLAELRSHIDEEKEWDALRRWIREYIDVFKSLGKYDEDIQLMDICRENEMADLLCDVLTLILEEKPYMPKGWSNLALAQFVQEQYEQSLESCGFALAIDPNDLDAILTKAHTLYAMGEKSASKPVFAEYLDKGGEVVQMIPYADVMFQEGEKEQAKANLQWLFNHMEHRLQEAKDRFDEAKKDGTKKPQDMLKADDLYYETHDLYLKILADMSDLYNRHECHHECIQINERLVQLAPDNADAHFMLGLSYMAIEKYQDASICFSNALKWAEDQVMMGVDIALTFMFNNFENFAIDMLELVSGIATEVDSPFARNIPAAKSIAYMKTGQKKLFIKNLRAACQESPELVKKVYEGYFPDDLPVSSWGDYAEKHINALFKNFAQGDLHLDSFS